MTISRLMVPSLSSQRSARKGNSAYTVNRTISVLSVILDMAVAKGLAAENIIRTNQKIEKLKVRGESKKIHVPSKSDLMAIVEHLKGYWAGHYSFSIQLIAYSGCRVGEARALKWRHVNFDENKLEIAGSKTVSSNRIIHMSQSLREVLEAKAKHVKKLFSEGTDGYLNERIMPIDCCNKQLTRACSELGIRRITNHDLRHYHTSCLEADIPASTVAAWMGHSDGGALLLKTYAHLRDQMATLRPQPHMKKLDPSEFWFEDILKSNAATHICLLWEIRRERIKRGNLNIDDSSHVEFLSLNADDPPDKRELSAG